MGELVLTDALRARRSRRNFRDDSVPREVVGRLIWAAQGVTSDDGKRTAPSAHSLHPLKLYLTAGHVEGLEQAIYSVSADAPAEFLHAVAGDMRRGLEKAALDDQPWIATAAGIITICADFIAPTQAFAEQPPFGTRGSRYVFIEAGAVAQNIHLQCAAEGLACVLVAGFRDEATAQVMNLEAPFAPVLHMCFGMPFD